MGRKTEETIAEGTSIAVAAARLTIKNQILVRTIIGEANYNAEDFLPGARTLINNLAAEAAEAADRLRKEGRSAWGKHTQSVGTHDYRGADVKNLRRRRKQSQGVADQLRMMVVDDDKVLAIIDEAREAAWADVSANLDRHLRQEVIRPESDPDYAMMRGARMQAVRLVDLQALSSQMKARNKALRGLDDDLAGV